MGAGEGAGVSNVEVRLICSVCEEDYEPEEFATDHDGFLVQNRRGQFICPECLRKHHRKWLPLVVFDFLLVIGFAMLTTSCLHAIYEGEDPILFSLASLVFTILMLIFGREHWHVVEHHLNEWE